MRATGGKGTRETQRHNRDVPAARSVHRLFFFLFNTHVQDIPMARPQTARGWRCFIVEQGGAEAEVECRIGCVATVWDGEVADMAEGLAN